MTTPAGSLPPSTMSHSKLIRIRFHRDSDDSDQDDIIRIKYVGDHRVRVTYQNDEGFSAEYVMCRGMLQTYLSSMFRLLAADKDPFQGVQIDLPLMPSMLLHPHTLGWQETDIMKQINLQCDAWTSAEDDIFAEEESLEASSVEDEEAAEGEEETEDKNKICADLNNARIEDNINEFNIPSIPDYRTWPNGNHHTFYSAT